jgi:uncharacterized glyoxalase superfamily protein PhnB
VLKNRSIPTNAVLPHIHYQNVTDAMVWLTEVFGFCEGYSYGEKGGPVLGAQMCLCDAVIMLRRAQPGIASPARLGYVSQSLTVFVEDARAHFQSSKVAGASIVEELHETAYGELQYSAVDLDGHAWTFSEHVKDVRPDQWGASVPAKQIYRYS